MIKTLRITSVVAVLFAAVVLASVLGFRRPIALLHLNLGTRGDKQVENILGGPSAVDRFKEKFGNKVKGGDDTAPPLVKEATALEGIINPRPEAGTPGLRNLPPKPTQGIKPPVAVSAKFELLGLCYSSDAKTSLAYIRTPEGAYQWVGPGTEIGRLTIKEIRRSSIVCVDGGRDVEMPVTPPPETASLLEADNASTATSEPSLPRPAVGTKATASPVKPSVTASPKAAGATTSPKTTAGATLPPAQISKEEQENLSQLGDRLKNAAGADAIDGNAAKDKLIAEYKSAQATPAEPNKVENPGASAAAGTDAAKAAREESRRQFLLKLKPRTNMK